jgi:hypothetical protein
VNVELLLLTNYLPSTRSISKQRVGPRGGGDRTLAGRDKVVGGNNEIKGFAIGAKGGRNRA